MDQFNNVTMDQIGVNLNGAAIVRENIADLVGNMIAYRACGKTDWLMKIKLKLKIVLCQ